MPVHASCTVETNQHILVAVIAAVALEWQPPVAAARPTALGTHSVERERGGVVAPPLLPGRFLVIIPGHGHEDDASLRVHRVRLYFAGTERELYPRRAVAPVAPRGTGAAPHAPGALFHLIVGVGALFPGNHAVEAVDRA